MRTRTLLQGILVISFLSNLSAQPDCQLILFVRDLTFTDKRNGYNEHLQQMMTGIESALLDFKCIKVVTRRRLADIINVQEDELAIRLSTNRNFDKNEIRQKVGANAYFQGEISSPDLNENGTISARIHALDGEILSSCILPFTTSLIGNSNTRVQLAKQLTDSLYLKLENCDCRLQRSEKHLHDSIEKLKSCEHTIMTIKKSLELTNDSLKRYQDLSFYNKSVSDSLLLLSSTAYNYYYERMPILKESQKNIIGVGSLLIPIYGIGHSFRTGKNISYSIFFNLLELGSIGAGVFYYTKVNESFKKAKTAADAGDINARDKHLNNVFENRSYFTGCLISAACTSLLNGIIVSARINKIKRTQDQLSN